MLLTNPVISKEIIKLKQWLYDIDHIKEIESRKGKRMGPIRSAKITPLYIPNEFFSTNYARIVHGEIEGFGGPMKRHRGMEDSFINDSDC